jgi:C4-dicarboxylate-specific signal transduction histidine kinase
MKETPERRLAIHSHHDGKGIRVEFRDSGCGINKDCRNREELFTLFHSDWGECHGKAPRDETHLGLGLFVVRRLLSPYGVHVRLEDCGDGTLTVLEIPTK